MRVLILGGTAEAGELASRLAAWPTVYVLTSLAGRTRTPRALPGAVRVGGFGGPEGLERFLRAERIERVIDATHPFAARMSANAEHACRAADVPRLRLLRPAWRAGPGDRWHEVESMAEAAEPLPSLGRRAFLSVGGTDLAAFASCRGVFFLVRGIERPTNLPLQDALWICGRGPFRLEAELELLRAHRIEVVIAKASGGAATWPKIEAARELGLPVIMQRRPPPPPGPVVADVREVLIWLGVPEFSPIGGAGAARGDGRERTAGCR